MIIHVDTHLAEPGEKDKTPEIPFLCLASLPGVWLLDMPGNIYQTRASYSKGLQ